MSETEKDDRCRDCNGNGLVSDMDPFGGETTYPCARCGGLGTVTVENAEQAASLPDGQWVEDVNGKPWCLIDTHMGFPQRMGMHKRSLTSLESLAYPLHLGDFVGECDHKWGTHEMGHCVRCGVVVAEPRPVFFDEEQMTLLREVAEMNARVQARGASDD